MKTGLLWFDGDPKHDLAHTVALAAARYRQKFGCVPNVCYVHKSAVLPGTGHVGNIEVKPLPTVLRYHFWIGCEGV